MKQIKEKVLGIVLIVASLTFACMAAYIITNAMKEKPVNATETTETMEIIS